MWLRRLLWWANGRSLDVAVAELDAATLDLRRSAKEMLERSEKRSLALQELRVELENEILRMQALNDQLRGRPGPWEGTLLDHLACVHNTEPVVQPGTLLNDDLTMWLWKAAWKGCKATNQWDLINAAAGIAQAIRTEGIPLSNGLRAAAVPARSGDPDA